MTPPDLITYIGHFSRKQTKFLQRSTGFVVSNALRLLGTGALLERLSARTIGLRILQLFGASKIPGGYSIPWDKLDLTDPEKPRLLCTLDELKRRYIMEI